MSKSSSVVSRPDSTQATTHVAEALATAKPKAARKVHKDDDKNYLCLTPEYKIRQKADSGYRAFLEIMAREGKFAEAAALLDSPGFDPREEDQARSLLQMLMVRKDVAAQLLANDAGWARHCKAKSEKLAASGEEVRVPASNRERVVDGKWLGNIPELISTCCGSYTCDPRKNRNVRKLDNAGVTFRRFPLETKRDEQVWLMMFPSKHAKKVHEALVTIHGDKAQREAIPSKFE